MLVLEQVWAPAIESPRLLLLDSLKTHEMERTLEIGGETKHGSPVYPSRHNGARTAYGCVSDAGFQAAMSLIVHQASLDEHLCENTTKRRQLITRIVCNAWASVTADTIRRGFVKAGLVQQLLSRAQSRFVINDSPYVWVTSWSWRGKTSRVLVVCVFTTGCTKLAIAQILCYTVWLV